MVVAQETVDILHLQPSCHLDDHLAVSKKLRMAEGIIHNQSLSIPFSLSMVEMIAVKTETLQTPRTNGRYVTAADIHTRILAEHDGKRGFFQIEVQRIEILMQPLVGVGKRRERHPSRVDTGGEQQYITTMHPTAFHKRSSNPTSPLVFWFIADPKPS